MSKLWGIVISNKYVYVGQKVNDVFGPNPHKMLALVADLQ